MKRHNLYEVDLDHLIAFCTVCGYTEIVVPSTRKGTTSKPICLARAKEKKAAQQEKEEIHREEKRSQPNWFSHHLLSEIDPIALTANCAVCGPTDIFKRQNAYKGKTYYVCGTRRREYMRKYKRLHYSGRPSNPHALSNVDEQAGTAVCAKCGPVKIEIWFGTKKINRRCVNAKK